jgi:hypothetical protein
MRRVISKNPSPDRKFTDPIHNQCACAYWLWILRIKWDIEQYITYQIFPARIKNSHTHNHDHMHVHNHNRFSEQESIVHSTYKVNFFQPGSKIRRHPLRVAPHVH